MPGEWETYYLMIGSSAAALIGLLFVVITLTGEIQSDRVAITQRTFLTPTVLHFVVVVVISSVALAPEIPTPVMALAVALPAAVGFVYGAAAVLRLTTGTVTPPHWTDYIFYGVLPAAGHLWLIAAAVAFWLGVAYAAHAIAFGALALLLLGLRDAWDLATWLAHNKQG